MQVVTIQGQYFSTFVAFGYANLCINPLIYAARYEIIKKSWKVLLRKNHG